MTDDFYEFKHECDAMPDGIRFIKLRGSRSSQFSVDQSKSHLALQSTTLYGFRFCPYCGKDMERED